MALRRFNFRLQTLLDVRQRQVDEAKAKVTKAQRQLDKEMASLTELQNQQNALSTDLHNLSNTKTDIDDIQQHYHHSEMLVAKIADQHQQILMAQNVVAEKQTQLQESLKTKKSVEKLKEKQYAAWEEDERKMEMRQLDDIATMHRHQDDDTGVTYE